MKDNLDQILRETYQNGEKPGDALNQAVLEQVRESEDMKNKGILSGGNEKRRGAERFAAVAAMIVAVLLLGSGVYAAGRHFGISFFAHRYGKSGLSREAEKQIEKEPEVAVKEAGKKNDFLNYKVSEILCDSRYLTATVDISAKDPEKYFVFSGYKDITRPLSELRNFHPADAKKGETIQGYCKRKELKPVHVDIIFTEKTDDILNFEGSDQIKEGESGEIYEVSAERLTKDKDFLMELQPVVALYEENGFSADQYGNILQVNVRDYSKEESAFYEPDEEGKKVLEELTMIPERIVLTSTGVRSYIQAEFICEKVPGDGLAPGIFELWDVEKGEEVDSDGLISSGYCATLGNNRFLCEQCHENIGLPEEIYVRSVDIDEIRKNEKVKAIRLVKVKK